jgi:hypothetical protein
VAYVFQVNIDLEYLIQGTAGTFQLVPAILQDHFCLLLNGITDRFPCLVHCLTDSLSQSVTGTPVTRMFLPFRSICTL